MNPYKTLTRALILGAALTLPAVSHSAEYRMGIFAGSASKDNQTELKAMYKPLIDYIAKATGDTIKPEISQSFGNMDRHLGNSRYSIFLGPPHVTAAAIEEGFEPVSKWNKPLFSLFIVLADSSYKTIADLKGARVGLASRETVAGPLCINALNKAGLRADKDFASVYEGKFMDVMTRQVQEKGLDTLCAGPGVWKSINEESPGKFRVIGESVRVPGFAFSIDSELSGKEKKKLTDVLVGIGQNPDGLRALQAITGSAAGATDTLATTAKEYFTANLLVEENKRRFNAQIPK
ncbi:MAG: PhnD/SsuA/transferrin family substrate-binding protein [Thiobacillus sp.]|nr:PhnD/SsuA/transferrin family substrate-binding protein [Thiobacillus sp.]